MITRDKLANVHPQRVRRYISNGEYTNSTNGCCNGYLQANVVVLKSEFAADFKEFCALNHRPAPLLEILNPGNPFTSVLANGADIRSTLPKYRIYRSDGSFTETTDITKQWSSDFVTFFLGCSFSFEDALKREGITMRHIAMNRNVPMYDTNIRTNNVGGFGRHMVVSMRPIKRTQILKAYQITEPWMNAHGSPIYFGPPQGIGIGDINDPQYGDAVPIKEDELPVFWPCGVTTQVAVRNALKKGIIDSVITHSPGHMFISDLTVQESQRLPCLGASNVTVPAMRVMNAKL